MAQGRQVAPADQAVLLTAASTSNFVRRSSNLGEACLRLGDSEIALDWLAGYLDSKTTLKVTTEALRADIEDLKLGWLRQALKFGSS
jgi:hypothetical protein